MDKSLHLFDTEAEFQAKYWSGEYEEPWVSLTDENGNVKFNKSEYERMLETPLTFEITGAGDICWLFINNSGNGEAKTLEYKKNNGNWTEITSTTGGSKISVSAGDEVQFRGDNVGMSYSSTTLHYRNEFSGTTAEFKVKGNIMSLLDKDDFLNKTTFDQGAEFAFFLLFNACSGLTDASDLVLPATALTASCYRSMFQQCTNLVHSPEELPATVLAEGCYRTMFPSCPSLETAPESIGDADTIMAPYACYNMFQNAVSLVETPELPATTMAAYCYYQMFYGCTSLTKAPEVLPATILAERCYQSMFSGTNITKAPEISATTLAPRCCEGMFRDCTSLRSAPSELPATTAAEMCYQQMFRGCSNLVTVPELPATTLADLCYSNMFTDCVRLKNAPELPANVLATGCYGAMFSNCTSLGSSPTLSATTLAMSCYDQMFYGCTNLTVGPPILPAATMYDYCCQEMFRGCTKLRNAPRLPATTLATSCYEGMFRNCSSLLYAQTELPALTLANSCYKNMFAGCSSIKVSPALSASVVPTGAYMGMFSGCSQLNYIKCLAADISATDSTTNWTSGVAATGRFEKSPAMENWTTGVNGIPVNWTIIEKSKITVTPTTLEFEPTGSTETITIQSTGNWTAVASDSWMQLSSASGSYLTTSITVTVADTQTSRAGNIVFTTGNKTATVSVSQSAGPLNEPLTFNITSAGNLVWKAGNASNTMAIQYSKNGGGWTTVTSTTGGVNISVSAGDVVKVKAPDGVTRTTLCPGNSDSNWNAFRGSTAGYTLAGNVMSLLDGENFGAMTAVTGDRAFLYLFRESTGLTDASNLLLPATSVSIDAYRSMFSNCTALVNPPEFPATTLAYGSYRAMFNTCSALTTFPMLPATAVSEMCYHYMFGNCTSLTTAPANMLPATVLDTSCYKQMFQGCTNLTAAPYLPAKTLAQESYCSMFSGCTKLNYIKCLATNITAASATTDWVSGVASSGTFVKDASMTWSRGVNGIPTSWTVEDEGSGTDYTLHDSTYMVRSQMQRIPDPLAIKNFNDGSASGNWTYQDGIMLKAIIDVYNEYNAQDYDLSGLLNYVNTYYDTLVQSNGTINTSKYTANELDDKEPAVALSALYDITNTAKYKSCLDMIYSGFTGVTKNADGVYWHKSTYPRQGWLDGLYMAQPFRAEYASKYLTGSAQSAVFDDVCLQITKMAERTYDSATGLYRHAYDASSLESQSATGWTDPNSLGGMQSYYAWGRGLGWMMMAIVDVLDYLPSSHTGRTGLINILTGACASIKTFADPTSGVWRNVPTEGALTSGNTNALESTSSSMFAYAFLKGVRKGYLPSSERTYALTLFTNLKNAFVSESGGRVTLANTCVGGNPGASATTKVGVLANYCSKDYMNDNTHGEAPYIWAALEYERLTSV